MTDELEKFYNENAGDIDEAFWDFCFNENRFETRNDAKVFYYNEYYFWEFVENTMERKRSWG